MEEEESKKKALSNEPEISSKTSSKITSYLSVLIKKVTVNCYLCLHNYVRMGK